MVTYGVLLLDIGMMVHLLQGDNIGMVIAGDRLLVYILQV